MSENSTVAVIGLGAAGLATMKNLAEEGFNVTGFERSSSIGGVWYYEDSKAKTTALKTTCTNGSKYKFCFTDFPHSPGTLELESIEFPTTAWLPANMFCSGLDTPVYPPAAQVHQYLQDYASHFNLLSCIETNTPVEKVTRDEKTGRWELRLRKNKTNGTEVVTRRFDRVVIASGINQRPVIPRIRGIEKFGGTVIHSQQYKGPDDFAAKRVLVVGLNNSAGDTATSLLGVAAKIYLSHRKGAIFLKRWNKNKPVDHDISWARLQIMQKYMDYVPKLYNWSVMQLQNQCHTLRPEWKLNDDLPPFTQCLPLMNDDIVAAMHDKEIVPVPNLVEVVDAQTVRLSDGTQLADLDVIIFCTGYKPDFSILGDYETEFQNLYHPPAHPTSEIEAKPLPKLYQNIFSLDYPNSLAYVCGVGFQMAVFHVYDLASMALAQVWKGVVALPPREMMRAQVDRHYRWIMSRAAKGSVHPDLVRAPEWYVWVNETAGTRVYENLGYGARGWRFWLRDREFCNTLMYGMFSPHTYRLFDGPRRKKWDGARGEILRVVEEINKM